MSVAREFTPQDLKPVLDRHHGMKLYQEALQRAGSPPDLLRFLNSYVHFNSVFGGGVASLAGQIALRRDLFRDPEEPMDALADSSAEVASTIFYAAIDEFGEPTKPSRATHRTMAQATLRAAAGFFGYDARSMNRLFLPDPATQHAIQRVLDGYGVHRVIDDRQILTAIGFHIASELFADEEFRALDTFLCEHFPELVTSLRATAAPIHGVLVPAYAWVLCHTTVEADHRDVGFAGANRALRYAANLIAPDSIKAWFIEGAAAFSTVQTSFAGSLLAVPSGTK